MSTDASGSWEEDLLNEREAAGRQAAQRAKAEREVAVSLATATMPSKLVAVTSEAVQERMTSSTSSVAVEKAETRQRRQPESGEQQASTGSYAFPPPTTSIVTPHAVADDGFDIATTKARTATSVKASSGRSSGQTRTPVKRRGPRIDINGDGVVLDSDRAGTDTELVMVLERRGEGWSEEVFPHVAMRRQPISPSLANVRMLKDLAPDSAQSFLTDAVGFSRDEAATVVSAAAAWRVTRGGRALVDRRLMRAVQENARAAVAALLQLGASTADVPGLLRSTPQILAVVPDSEWNRHLLEYIVRTKAPGGGRFGPLKLKHIHRAGPSKTELAAIERRKKKGDGRTIRTGSDPMKPWVEAVRMKRLSGELSQEQLYLIDVAGFDADVRPKKGDESPRTWEMWFDELVEYQCTTGMKEVPMERDGAGLGLWLSRQKVKHRDGVLPEKACRRLLAMGVSFEGFEASGRHPEAAATDSGEVDIETGEIRSGITGKDKDLPRANSSSGPKSKAIVADDDNASVMTPAARWVTSSIVSEATSVGGGGGGEWVGLDHGTVEMLQALQAFAALEGACAEPPLGSQLAVWLVVVRSRAAGRWGSDGDGRDGDAAMSRAERAALVAAGVELENFSTAWLGELQQYASLRRHRGTLHAPAALATWVRRQRAAAAMGQLSRAQLLRLRAAGMSGLAGALMLDEFVMQAAETLVDPTLTEEGARAAWDAARETPWRQAREDISANQELCILDPATVGQPVRRHPVLTGQSRARARTDEERGGHEGVRAETQKGASEPNLFTSARTLEYMKSHGF